MNTMLHRERDEDVEDTTRRPAYGKDREITLGTTLILGIFFALAVFGAVFFGFGYSMGSKHVASTSSALAESSSSAPFNSFKPAPGSPLAGTTPVRSPAGPTVAVPLAGDSATTTDVPFVPKAPLGTRAPAAVSTIDEPAVPTPTARVPLAAALPLAPPPALAAGPGQSMVQVAAVSHQEDADLLVSTLKRHGYNVGIHGEAQDRLMHIQIGPFASRKDADVIRQKLLADGFNAIIK